MASIYVYSVSSTSISVRLTGLQTSGVDYTRKCTWAAYEKSTNNAAASGNSYITQGAEQGGDITLSGLSPNTAYMVYCTVYRTDTGEFLASIPSVDVTTNSSGGGGGSSGGDSGETTTVTKWDWFGVNGDAWAEETTAAYNAITNKTATTNFSRYVWNDMVAKVYDIAMASTKYWDSDYAFHYETLMSQKPYELTAVKFNSLRNNIELVGNYVGLGYRTGIGVVAPGDVVRGEFFITLTNYMNACIDKL